MPTSKGTIGPLKKVGAGYVIERKSSNARVATASGVTRRAAFDKGRKRVVEDESALPLRKQPSYPVAGANIGQIKQSHSR